MITKLYALKGLLLFTAVLLICQVSCVNQEHDAYEKANPAVPVRVISLAPSITETFFALGLMGRLVGVTDYCNYPPEARTITRVGNYLDPNYEAILTLKPDMVFLLSEHSPVKEFLKKNAIRYKEIDNHDLKSILNSFSIIGAVFGRGKEARQMQNAFSAELDSFSSVKNSSPVLRKPRILFCVGRNGVGSGAVSELWVAGRRTFYSELIQASGAVNVITDSLVEYPALSAEGIITLKPDIIIDVMPSMDSHAANRGKNDWLSLTIVPAVRYGRIYCLTRDYVTIPGPRIMYLLRDLRKIVKDYSPARDT